MECGNINLKISQASGSKLPCNQQSTVIVPCHQVSALQTSVLFCAHNEIPAVANQLMHLLNLLFKLETRPDGSAAETTDGLPKIGLVWR